MKQDYIPQKQSDLGIISLILGILGMVLSCTSLGFGLCVVGVILGIIGLLEKNRKHGTAIAGFICSVIGAGVFSAIVIGTQIFDYYQETTASTAETETTIEEEEVYEFKDSEFEVSEYFYETTMGVTHYLLVVKNNSPKTAEISGQAVAYSENNTLLDTDDARSEILAPGEEQVLCFYFGEVVNVDHFEYVLNYKTTSTKSIFGSIEIIKEVQTEDGFEMIYTNTGKETIEHLEVQILFFKGEELVFYGPAYLDDIKPGRTKSQQIYVIEEYGEDYDSVKYFYKGSEK